MTDLRHDRVASPLGDLLVIADDADRLRAVYLPAHRRGPAAAPGRRDRGGVLGDAAAQLGAYFAGERTVFELPTATSGTPFQERVWSALRAVPYGETTTYGELAAQLGLTPRGSRAVGAANGRNPLSVVAPCHRVIGSSGALTGYGGGLDAKRLLLAHEAQVAGLALAVGA